LGNISVHDPSLDLTISIGAFPYKSFAGVGTVNRARESRYILFYLLTFHLEFYFCSSRFP
jgi:hypothetical protein